MNRRRVAAVLAADSELQILPRLPPALHAHPDHFADALDVDRRERIPVENLAVLVYLQKLASVVARETEGELGEIVRAEREELRFGRDLIGGDRAAPDARSRRAAA